MFSQRFRQRQAEAKFRPAISRVGCCQLSAPGVRQGTGHRKPQAHVAAKRLAAGCMRGYWVLYVVCGEKRCKEVRHDIGRYAGAVVAHHLFILILPLRIASGAGGQGDQTAGALCRS